MSTRPSVALKTLPLFSSTCAECSRPAMNRPVRIREGIILGDPHTFLSIGLGEGVKGHGGSPHAHFPIYQNQDPQQPHPSVLTSSFSQTCSFLGGGNRNTKCENTNEGRSMSFPHGPYFHQGECVISPSSQSVITPSVPLPENNLKKN